MQVVVGPSTSAASFSSICGMAPKLHIRGTWGMILQVPYSMKAVSARQPIVANGMLAVLNMALAHCSCNQSSSSTARSLLPCFRLDILHTSTKLYGGGIRSLHCKATVMAPSETEAHVMMRSETEDHAFVPIETGDSTQHPQVEGSTNHEISDKFADELKAFDTLHAQVQASRLNAAIGEADLDALEAAVGRMEMVMSSTALTECWHVGSACLKVAWLYSDASDAAKETPSKVLACGHRALSFLESLQVPVWTFVSCSYVLANAYFKSEKFEDAVHHLEKATSMIKDLEAKGALNTEQTQLVDAVHSLLQNSRVRFGQHLSNKAREYLCEKEDHQLFISTMKKAIGVLNMCTDPQPASVAAQLEGSLGFFYLQTDQANEALPHLKNSLAKLTSIHGPQSPKLAIMLNHLGVAYTEVCKLDEALKHFEAAKAILARHTREKGDGTEVTLYNNISQVYFLRGRLDDAIASQRRFIEILKQNVKDNIETPFSLEGAEEKLEEMLQQAKAEKRRQ